ncbi:MAG: GGDEF domain-containing phosphodiesterase [Ruminococcus flavefaciens]|nr:GGDEF domain-containing phosphodiesterase [Ruminococcus flavefaciens]MCM1231039.1 GGDEF domain-containing phosphodiesterase [Ruminococcus flavefaciens]
MDKNFITDDIRSLMLEMLTDDSGSIHIFWNCVRNTMVQLCGNIFPDGTANPLEYIRKSGWIESSAECAFDVFADKIRDGIDSGIDTNSVSIDIPMKLPENKDYSLYHIHVLFLRDDNSRIVCTHINIRQYTEKEISDRKILNTFTSEKAPQIFGQRITRMMNKYTDKGIAFVQFDIERFKLINDMYGVEIGDEIIKFMNDSLAVICSDDQPFARLTADVFMIVISFSQEDEILEFIHKLETSLSGYKNIDYRLIFGVAIAEDRTIHTRRHGDNATLARQSVKGSALNNIGFYNGNLKTELYHQQTIEEDMLRAVENNEFVMFLQPKYSISTSKIIGAEALTRWIHPEKGMISPVEFIPIFEKNGFILKLDQIIWESACKKIREWIDTGIEPVPISVNISREYLNSFDVVGYFRMLIEKYDIPIHLLEAEITESVDSEDTSEVVNKMKQVGFTMLMDDFGSGYSSLNMLKTTPFDVLKIDRNFLSEFMESDKGRKIIAHTISMSQDIGLDIIAEGVETNEQAQFLSRCGCDIAQGFYYSRPVSTEEFDRRLKKEQNKI